jgi:hypothetical protein
MGCRLLRHHWRMKQKNVRLVINVAKTKIMKIGNWMSSELFRVGTEELQECDELCYLDSTINNDDGCDTEIKANSNFGR